MREPTDTARNDPCPCGSGKKYKRCCGHASPSTVRAAPRTNPEHGSTRLVPSTASTSLRRAADRSPSWSSADPEALNRLAIAACDAGDLRRAEALLRRALDAKPGDGLLHMHLGIVLREQWRLDEAVSSFQQAAALRTDAPEVYYNLALAQSDRDTLDRGAASFQHAAILLQDIETAQDLAWNLLELGKPEHALNFLRRALALAPGNPEILAQMGGLLTELGRFDEARGCLSEAQRLAPESAEVAEHLGGFLLETGQPIEAEAQLRRALALQPGEASLHYQLARVRMRSLELSEAEAELEKALAIDPGLSPAHWMTGLIRLTQGDYRRGFEKFEWRWADARISGARRRLPRPRWSGGPIEAKRILLHAEQGYGDAIQFARFASLVAARGASVVVECPLPLVRLFRTLEGVADVVARGEAMPAFDLYCPLMSLANALGVSLATLPAPPTYLRTEPGLVEEWRARLGVGDGFLVGLAWSGNPQYRADARRSLPVELLESLRDIAGVRFVSLNKNAAGVGEAPTWVEDYTGSIDDFACTAAVMANLDLVISVDTAVAHLAGALGRPVWLMNRFDTDWRWLLDREDSPWYPSMRIFRQPVPGGWAAVVERVADELRAVMRQRHYVERLPSPRGAVASR